jgi:endo-1,4-beta-xylanase
MLEVILMRAKRAEDPLLSASRKSRSSAALTRGIRMTAALCAVPAMLGAQQTLKDAFKDAFLVGAAVNPRQFTEGDARGAGIVKQQINTISPENSLKWEVVHPQLGRYDFSQGDAYVDFGTKNGMFTIGHTLVWHSQVPRWVFQDSTGQPLTRDALLARMREHIFTVVGRYKGRIKGWDVVNEALNEDGTLRKSPWFTIIGPDYIEHAFKFAHEADPSAELYYNDYNLEVPAKRDGAVALVKSLKAAGVTIHAVGSQAHDRIDLARSVILHDSSIAMISAAGVKVNITELDVDVLPRGGRGNTADVGAGGQSTAPNMNPFTAGIPDSILQTQAKRYADLFAVFLKYQSVIDRITFWGVTDGDSWLNNFPMRGRTNYALPFDRQGLPKPAFDAIMRVAREARTRSN